MNVLTTVKSALKFVQQNPTITSSVAGLVLEAVTTGKISPTILIGVITAIGAAKTAHKKITTGKVLD